MSAPVSIPQDLVETLRAAGAVTVLTGAGISAESGVPTFRDAQTGLWARYDPMQLATPEAFEHDPRLGGEWYGWRRKLVAEADPNAGHEVLVRMERSVPRFALITQNVDGLHRRAGSRNVTELHGNITRSKCSAEDVPIDRFDPDAAPPTCPSCGAPLRPDVVWFGEPLPFTALEAAFEAARSCDLLLSVGTSSVVEPAASLPFEALRAGAAVAEINPANTPLTSHATYRLRAKAGEALTDLVEAAFPN